MMKEINWKDLFAFTRREKRGILLLMLLIAGNIVLNLIYPHMAEEEVQISPEVLLRIDSLQAGISRYQNRQDDENNFSYYTNNNYASKSSKKRELTPFPFDPNKLDEAGWVQLGLSEKEAAMVLKYRAAGGFFYKKEDLKKLYCVSDEDYNILEPCIRIDTAAFPSVKSRYSENTNRVVELNKADTADLLAVPGIGPYYAKMILKYRDLLGGFVSENQLVEVYGLEDKYHRLKKYVEVSPAVYRKININDADYSDLLKHPYIDKKAAYIISEHRRLKGRYGSVEELKKMHGLADSLLVKLTPYLSVE